MKKWIIALLLMLALCAPALASTASDIAADYEQGAVGVWKCVFSDKKPTLDAGEAIEIIPLADYESYQKNRFVVMANARGDAYLCYWSDPAFIEIGSINFSSDGNLMTLYDSEKLIVLERVE